ncbi:MAG: 16S rRNA (guanine(527)-N(7))-methyltransferase RsmG [Thermoleophilaceae bacterium]
MRHRLDDHQHSQLELLLEGLAAEADPHTTVSGPGEAARIHLGDSLSILGLPAIAGAMRLADVGAGAGFPGLALAVALPSASVVLIESVARKCAVIARLARRAGVENATTLNARAEDHARAGGANRYGVVTARAVAPLGVLVEYAAPLLTLDGSLVAYKGRRDAGEEKAATRAARETGMELTDVRHVTPFEGARDRHLHVYRKVAPTPDRYPRRAGVARKRPLA